MKSIVVAFNKQLKELVTKLNIMIPDNDDLKLAKNMFHVPIMTKENFYLQQFYEHIKDFEEKIMLKDEDFFLNFNISDFFKVPQDINTDVLDKQKEAKEIWERFDSESKNALWLYVQLLLKLAKKYYKK